MPEPTLEQSSAGAVIDHLRTQIREHDVAYYNQDRPITDDAQYDELKRQLIDMETQPSTPDRSGLTYPTGWWRRIIGL